MCEEMYTIPENGIPAVFGNTGIELGITYEFVRWVAENWYKNMVVIKPEVSFDWVVKNYGKPIFSKIRSDNLEMWQNGKRYPNLIKRMIIGVDNKGNRSRKTKLADRDIHALHDDFPIKATAKCCKYLKKEPFKKYMKENGILGSATGERMAEGGAREMNANRRAHDADSRICTTVSNGLIKKRPIIDWSDEDVEEFIKQYNVPLSEAYTKYGFKRTGRMACPYANNIALGEDLRYLHDHEPNRYKAAMHWLKDVYIAENVILPFDEEYEKEREKMWREMYEPMRQEMLRKYRPNSKLIKDQEQTTIFEFLGE